MAGVIRRLVRVSDMPTHLPARAAVAAVPSRVPAMIAVTLAFTALIVMNVRTLTPYAPAYGGGAKVWRSF